MARRKSKDLGAMELAGLLQQDSTFTPVSPLGSRDYLAARGNQRGTTYGIHYPEWNRPGRPRPARIAMNMAFPGNVGGTFGHELAHNALRRYGITGGSRHHDIIEPYLSKNYMGKGRHRQVGPDFARPEGPAGRYGRLPKNETWSGSPSEPSQELGLPFTVKDIEGSLAGSAEGRRRRAWWNANRAALARRMASITGGRGR